MVSGCQEILSQDFPELNRQTAIMILEKSINNNNYSLDMNWNIENIQISMGDELHLRIVAKDNNAIDGYQISRSQLIIGRFPSLENLFSEIEELEDADQIYNEPKTPYTQKLIDAIPEGKLEDIKRHLESKGVKVG